MTKSNQKLITQCQKLLMTKKQDLINSLKVVDPILSERFTGDEADMAQTHLQQNSSISQRERMLTLLKEVDAALERIENNTFGICEETEEPIEDKRLLAMPWTRLSLRGAETREAIRKKFA